MKWLLIAVFYYFIETEIETIRNSQKRVKLPVNCRDQGSDQYTQAFTKECHNELW